MTMEDNKADINRLGKQEEVKKDEFVEAKKDELNAYQTQTIAKCFNSLRDIVYAANGIGPVTYGI